jgi:hypothetical protein
MTIIDATGLKNLNEQLHGHESLSDLTIENAQDLEEFDAISNLHALKELNIWGGGEHLTHLDFLSSLGALRDLDLQECVALKSIEGFLSELSSLRTLSLFRCTSLVSLEGLAGSRGLNGLYIEGCTALSDISGLRGLDSILHLKLARCPSIPSLEVVQTLTSIKNLNLLGGNGGLQSVTGATRIPNLDFLRGLSSLEVLVFNSCECFVSMKDLGELRSLRHLSIANCTSLKSLSGIEGVKNITHLSLQDCTTLGSILGIERLASLKSASLIRCSSLTSVDELLKIESLTDLSLIGCSSLNCTDALISILEKVSVQLPKGFSLTVPIHCSKCGETDFAGSFRSRYTRASWGQVQVSREVSGVGNNLLSSISEAWKSLEAEANQEVEEHVSPDDELHTSYEVAADVTCSACEEALELEGVQFPRVNDAQDPPQSASGPWKVTHEVPSHLLMPLSVQDVESEAQEDRLACPFCSTGRILLTGAAVRVSFEGGTQSGDINFMDAKRDDSPETWEKRLEYYEANTNSEESEISHAKMGYRTGLRCSEWNCWRAEGIKDREDFMAIFLAGTTLAAAARVTNLREALVGLDSIPEDAHLQLNTAVEQNARSIVSEKFQANGIGNEVNLGLSTVSSWIQSATSSNLDISNLALLAKDLLPTDSVEWNLLDYREDLTREKIERLWEVYVEGDCEVRFDMAGRTITPEAVEWILEMADTLGDARITLDFLTKEAAITLAKAKGYVEVHLYVKELTPEAVQGLEGFGDRDSDGLSLYVYTEKISAEVARSLWSLKCPRLDSLGISALEWESGALNGVDSSYIRSLCFCGVPSLSKLELESVTRRVTERASDPNNKGAWHVGFNNDEAEMRYYCPAGSNTEPEITYSHGSVYASEQEGDEYVVYFKFNKGIQLPVKTREELPQTDLLDFHRPVLR